MRFSVEFIAYHIVVSLFSACVFFPPTEVVQAGFTIEALLSGHLGSQDMYFVFYHIRRSAATVILHSCLPLTYLIGLHLFCAPDLDLLSWSLWPWIWLAALLMPACGVMLVYYWSRQGWKRHPVSRLLAAHGDARACWTVVASEINTEYRRADKFSCGPPGRRLSVTDSWILLTTRYGLNAARKSDVHMSLQSSRQHQLSHLSPHGVQIVTVRVASVNPAVQPLTLRMSSTEFGDFKSVVPAPLTNTRQIIIKQTLSELFISAFTEQVERNPRYRMSSSAAAELEPCVGCMLSVADVKLEKHCDEPARGRCQPCACRPMWCTGCMARWFASRQAQSAPDTWLEGISPCPTCRALFCVLDVCRLERSPSST